MRNWFFLLGILLFGICETQAQAFSIFPRERKVASWDLVLPSTRKSILDKDNGMERVTLLDEFMNDSSSSEVRDPLISGVTDSNVLDIKEDETLFGPRLYRFGALNGSLYEQIQGGNNAHLWSLHWASDSAFIDSGELIPLLLVDFYGEDTLKNILWCISELDSEILNFKWIHEALGDSCWRNVAWEERWQRGDTFAYFVMDDYLLPLPCNHESIYLYYGGAKDITLTIDYDFAGGLTLDECLPFIEEHVEHLRAFHQEDCLTETPQLTIEVGIRNAAIVEIREFMRKISDLGIRIELVFPWER